MDSRLSEESIAYQKFLETDVPPPTSLNIEAIRNRNSLTYEKANEKLIGTFKGLEEERSVKIDHGIEIPITVYTPMDAKKDKLIVFFHGGIWILGSRKTHQTMVNMIADATKSIWISVEYRLAPEYKFPIWLDDAQAVTKYVLDHRSDFGGNESSKVGVAGDSAGGFISASLSRTLANIDFQILITPVLDCFRRLPWSKEFDHVRYGLSSEVFQWITTMAFRSDMDAKDIRLNILEQEADKSIPKCLFIVAELDMLREDSYEYQKILEKAGVKTKLILIEGSLHPFLSYPGLYKRSCAKAIEAIQIFMDSL